MQSIEPEISRCIQSISTQQNDDESFLITAHCCFPSTFIGFQGHFIDNPILPAIVQLAVVRQISEKVAQTSLLPVEFSKTKFRAMVRPEQQLIATITLSKEAASWRGKFGLKTDNDEQVAAGNFCFSTDLEQ